MEKQETIKSQIKETTQNIPKTSKNNLIRTSTQPFNKIKHINTLIYNDIISLNLEKDSSIILSEKEKNYMNVIDRLLKTIDDLKIQKPEKENLNIPDQFRFNNNNTQIESRSKGISFSKINTLNSPEGQKIKNLFDNEDINKNDSLLEEFFEFKNEDFEKYKFVMLEKYQFPSSIKINKEIQSEGKLIRFFENSVIDVISKNKNLTRVKKFV